MLSEARRLATEASTAEASSSASADYYGCLSSQFTWDPAHLGANVTLSADNRTATHATSQWNSVIGAQWLRGGLFEIKVATDNVDNSSFYIGVCEHGYWETYAAGIEEGEDVLPRDSQHVICMHGDGRMFIKGLEKHWGMMRLSSGEPLVISLDFVSGVATFKQVRTVSGKRKEAVAEVAGLFGEATVVACFGGREQQLRIEATAIEDDGLPREKVRDTFATATASRGSWSKVRDDVFAGTEFQEPVPFSSSKKIPTYAEQVRDIARDLGSS